MKYIFLILLLSVTCFASNPKFRKNDYVEFKIPYFYSNFCTNTGTITEFVHSINSYKIEASRLNNADDNGECVFWVEEENIKLKK